MAAGTQWMEDFLKDLPKILLKYYIRGTFQNCAGKLYSLYKEGSADVKAVIDQSGCISCGLCAETCPEVFRMSEDGPAEVYGEIVDEVQQSAEKARDNCPVSVISLIV
jgi:ferredoxin